MSKKPNLYRWIQVVLILQILIGLICGGLCVQAVYFRNVYKTFDSTLARTEKDLNAAIPPSLDPKHFLLSAIKSEMLSLRSQGMGFVYLIAATSVSLIILPLVILLILPQSDTLRRL